MAESPFGGAAVGRASRGSGFDLGGFGRVVVVLGPRVPGLLGFAPGARFDAACLRLGRRLVASSRALGAPTLRDQPL